jgi:hypothetical protein
MSVQVNHARTLHTLVVYRARGTWCYDDPAVGVTGEPFVLGTDKALDALRLKFVGGKRHDPFRVTFSSKPFPGALIAARVYPADESWNLYDFTIGVGTMEGWLCPHLLDYFESAPDTIYVRAEAL